MCKEEDIILDSFSAFGEEAAQDVFQTFFDACDFQNINFEDSDEVLEPDFNLNLFTYPDGQ